MVYIRHDNVIKQVGINLRKIRMDKGVSQEQLSYDTEISINQIGRIERGQINTSVSTLYEISSALDIDIQELFKNIKNSKS
jgi:transcriptional regulator with XRE-family HTH domain